MAQGRLPVPIWARAGQKSDLSVSALINIREAPLTIEKQVKERIGLKRAKFWAALIRVAAFG